MKLLSIILVTILSMALFCQEKNLTLSEIMFYPASGNNEFIEIYNLSSHSIDLTGYKIKYYSSPPDSLVNTGNGYILQPHSYAVIFEGDYELSSGIYEAAVPDEALVFKIEDNSFGSSGMSNSSSRNILLLNADNDTVDSYWYSADNNISVSDEKINQNEGNLNNWHNSISMNGTPGYKNSVSKYDFDLLVSSVVILPAMITSNDQINVIIEILNNGIKTAKDFGLELYLDSNDDSSFSVIELIYSGEYESLPAGDSLEIVIDLGSKPQKTYPLLASVKYLLDQDSINNNMKFPITVYPIPAKYNDIIINEVMYAPLSPEPEWVELFNRSDLSVNLRSWRFSDYTSINTITKYDHFVNPGEYAILTKDSSLLKKYPGIRDLIVFNLPALNNTGDLIVLYDSLNNCIDSLEYLPSWGGSAGSRSLERISSEELSVSQYNWGTCTNSGTPGKYNSISPKSRDLAVTSITFNKPYAIEGIPLDVIINIKNNGTSSSGAFQIILSGKSVDDDHYKVLTSLYGNSLLSKDTLLFKYIYSEYSTGLNYLTAQLLFDQDEDETNNVFDTSFTAVKLNEIRGDLVINEIMYAPVNPEPEWIELFNQSDKEIVFKNYQLADKNDTIKISAPAFTILPNQYLIVAKDSSVISFYEIDTKYITARFPSLNNTGDKIVLIDSLNRTIDSLEYSSSWGGNSGRSLERKNSNGPSIEKLNWGSCKVFPTPGKINSISKLYIDLSLSSFRNDEYFIEGDNPNFTVTIKNEGLNVVSQAELLIYNDIEHDSLLLYQQEPLLILQTGVLKPDDSLSLSFQVQDLNWGMNYLIAKIRLAADQDSSDNIAFSAIQCVRLNELQHDIIINEIMYAPLAPEPEWIELYNRSNKTINFAQYILRDNSSQAKLKCEPVELLPEEYLIIAKDSSFYNYYDIDSKVLISDFPVLNNTFDSIMLIDSLNRTIDSVRYYAAWGGKEGRSLERIDLDNYNSDSLNWKQSVTKATPGELNSASLKKFSIGISEAAFYPENPVKGEKVSLSIKVKNHGRGVCLFNVLIYEDTNIDAIPDALVFEYPLRHLEPKDSTAIIIENLVQSIDKEHAYYAFLKCDIDEDSSDNSFYKKISPVSVSAPVLINEIMYTPVDGEPEWIELYNNSKEHVNLRNWDISDILSTPVKVKITEQDYYLPAGEYIVLSRDSSIEYFHENISGPVLVIKLPVLNNTEEGIILRDFAGNTIDSVLFNSSWGGQNGISLERRSFADNNIKMNWGSSVSSGRSTPGKVNSIAEKQYDLKVSSVSYTPGFPIAGDNIILSVQVVNSGKNISGNFSVRLYYKNSINDDYILSAEIGSTVLSAGDSVMIINTESIQIDSVLYIHAEVFLLQDEDTSNNSAYFTIRAGYKQNTILINEIMYNPIENNAEWIELVNLSDDHVNLKDWLIGTSISNMKTLTDTIFLLKPSEYIVVRNNTSGILNVPEQTTVLRNTFSLSNNSGNIIIRDFRKALIDSMSYKSGWGSRKGVSLERISLSMQTNDSSNWHLSLDNNRSTPGRKNSVTELQNYYAGDVLINEIMYDPAENNSEFVELYNAGMHQIDIGGWTITESGGTSFPVCDYHFELAPDQYFIVAADSSIIINYPDMRNHIMNILNNKDLYLNQSSDHLVLKDALGSLIDSVYYTNDYHNKHIQPTKNRSLERINSGFNSVSESNWSTSVNLHGATPGFINSIHAKNDIKGKSISIAPNPFSPDNDGYEDFTIINYQFDQDISLIRLKIFDSQGRLVRTITDYLITGSGGSIIFDGLNEDGNALSIGIYIVLIEAVTNSSDILKNKTVVVVARKI